MAKNFMSIGIPEAAVIGVGFAFLTFVSIILTFSLGINSAPFVFVAILILQIVMVVYTRFDFKNLRSFVVILVVWILMILFLFDLLFARSAIH